MAAMTNPRSVSEVEKGTLRYSGGKVYDKLHEDIESRFNNIQIAAKKTLATTALIQDEVTEVFRLTARTAGSEAEARLKMYRRLFKKSMQLYGLILQDFEEQDWLFMTATQGAMIEKHESVLAKEQNGKHKQQRQLEEAERRLSQAAKELENIKARNSRTDRQIEDLKLDLDNMKWSETMELDCQMQSDSSDCEIVEWEEGEAETMKD
jgi:hypothetical protein